jgi:E3 ubiquitin-protein ligase MUL1
VIDLDTVKDLSKFVEENGVVQVDNDITIPYIVIEGCSVTPLKSSLESHYQNVKGVIRQFSIVEHKRTLSRSGFWYDSQRTIQTYAKHVPFTLGRGLEVLDYTEATEIDLEVTYDKFDSAVSGLSDHLWGFLTGDRQRGVQTTEQMLVNDTSLTAVGEPVLCKDGKLKIQAPTNGDDYYLITDTSKSLIKRLQGGSNALRICLGIFAGVGFGIATWAGIKYYKNYVDHQADLRSQDLLRQIARDRRIAENNGDPGEEVPEEIPEAIACVVCLTQQREVILLDCGHVCVCADCAGEIMRTRPICPVCRARIDRVAAAFMA